MLCKGLEAVLQLRDEGDKDLPHPSAIPDLPIAMCFEFHIPIQSLLRESETTESLRLEVWQVRFPLWCERIFDGVV